MNSQFAGGPGFLAFVVTFVVVAAAIVLFRSLSSHLRKIRTHPPKDEAEPSGVVEDDQGASDEVADEPRDS